MVADDYGVQSADMATVKEEINGRLDGVVRGDRGGRRFCVVALSG
jgi:hypothetical protein